MKLKIFAPKPNQASWKTSLLNFCLFSFLIGTALVFVGGFIFLLYINKDLPPIDSLKTYEPREVSLVYSNEGEVIGEFFEQRRQVVSDIPEVIKNAFIAAEDSSFYTHQGLDFLGILRAAYINIKAGRAAQGASTITQQVARAFLLTREKTLRRKIKEAILSWHIEQSLTKEEILHLYLNHIYLGHGAYGVAAAAQVYFGKKLHEVNVAEAAILGGLPQAPSRYSPARNPDRVKRRQLYVLRQMYESGFISETEYNTATRQEVLIEPRVNMNKTIAPYFVDYIRQYLMKKYGSRMVLQDGLRIHTTLNLDMQRHAQNALRKGLSALEKRQGYRGVTQSYPPEEIQKYFEGRTFEERDDSTVVSNKELEVDISEVENAGEIKMKPRPPLEEGDFLEGIVVEVDDEKGEVLVEYEPGYFAVILLEDMKWAHARRKDLDDEDEEIKPVRKPSDVLKVGDVIVMTVKSLEFKREKEKEESEKEEEEGVPDEAMGEEPEVPMIQAVLEQDTEVEGALLSIDPRNGYIKAMVGGYNFRRSEFNRTIQAKRQPGSAFKPIIFAAALDLGFTPATIVQDSPITFENELFAEKYRPRNYDNKFKGDMPLRTVLLQSRNIPTIKILNQVGIPRAIAYARKLGIESPLSKDVTLALGSSVVTLADIMKPYIVFANGGYPKEQIFIKRVEDRHGNIIEDNAFEDFHLGVVENIDNAIDRVLNEVKSVALSRDPDELKDETASFLKDTEKKELKRVASELKPGQVLSSETAFLVTQLLKENVLYGSGRRARVLERPAAGKTGTTNESRDAWFLGFVPQLVTGVWVGYDDLRRLGRYETGSRAAVPIWTDFMKQATAPLPKEEFSEPDNIEFVKIDPRTGYLAGPNTKGAVYEAFVKGTAPKTEKPAVAEGQDNYYR